MTERNTIDGFAEKFHVSLTAMKILLSGMIDGVAFQNIMLSDDTLTLKR